MFTTPKFLHRSTIYDKDGKMYELCRHGNDFEYHELCPESGDIKNLESLKRDSNFKIIFHLQQFETDESPTENQDINFPHDHIQGVGYNKPIYEWPGKLMLSGRTMKAGSFKLPEFEENEYWEGFSYIYTQSPWLQSPWLQNPPSPTYYAQLSHGIVEPTHFESHFFLEDIVQRVEETLKELEFSFSFIHSKCAWNCSYQKDASHASFVIRVYRFPAKLDNSNYIVEMQRLDGYVLILRSFYETFSEKLRDERLEEIVPIWPESTNLSPAVDSSEPHCELARSLDIV